MVICQPKMKYSDICDAEFNIELLKLESCDFTKDWFWSLRAFEVIWGVKVVKTTQTLFF